MSYTLEQVFIESLVPCRANEAVAELRLVAIAGLRDTENAAGQTDRYALFVHRSLCPLCRDGRNDLRLEEASKTRSENAKKTGEKSPVLSIEFIFGKLKFVFQAELKPPYRLAKHFQVRDAPVAIQIKVLVLTVVDSRGDNITLVLIAGTLNTSPIRA